MRPPKAVLGLTAALDRLKPCLQACQTLLTEGVSIAKLKALPSMLTSNPTKASTKNPETDKYRHRTRCVSAGDPAFLCADVALAESATGFESKYSLEEGIS